MVIIPQRAFRWYQLPCSVSGATAKSVVLGMGLEFCPDIMDKSVGIFDFLRPPPSNLGDGAGPPAQLQIKWDNIVASGTRVFMWIGFPEPSVTRAGMQNCIYHSKVIDLPAPPGEIPFAATAAHCAVV